MGSLLDYLPGINAVLISTSGAAILLGVRFIRQGRRDQHKRSMLIATALATLFLIFYIWRISVQGVNPFHGPAAARSLYLALLTGHIGVALVSAPMVLFVLYFALSGRFQRHKRLARWTYPLWVFVSVTGVLVYLFLYRLF